MQPVQISMPRETRDLLVRALLALALAYLADASIAATPFAAGQAWKGNYRCGGQTLDLSLAVRGAGVGAPTQDQGQRANFQGEVTATTQGGPQTYPITGTYSNRGSPNIAIRPTGGQKLPGGFVPFAMVGDLEINGREMRGSVNFYGCEGFTLTRMAGDAAEAASIAADPAASVAALGREPTILDFLPKGPKLTPQDCLQGQMEAMQWVQQLVAARHMKYDAYAWQTAVPEHWARFSQQNSELGYWTRDNGSGDCAARAKLRGWLRAIGDSAANIDDPQSLRSSERFIRDAREKLAQAKAAFSVTKAADDQRYQEAVAKQAVEKGEVERAASLDVDKVALGSRFDAVREVAPQALCTFSAKTIDCQRVLQPCPAKRKALARAEDQLRVARGNRARPTQVAELIQRVGDATSVVSRCDLVFAQSAAARSKLLHIDQKINAAQFGFEDERLVEIVFAGVDNGVAIRTLWTRRYGAPNVRTETRSVVDRVSDSVPIYAGHPAWNATVGGFQTETIFRDVTRYINIDHETWTGPNFVATHSEGRFTTLRLERLRN